MTKRLAVTREAAGSEHDDGPGKSNPSPRECREVRPIPPFASILERCSAAPEPGMVTIALTDLRQIVRGFLAAIPFDRDEYLHWYPDFARLEAEGRIRSARDHWLEYGYFEGRLLYGWEGLPLDIDQELLSAPAAYFEWLRVGRQAERSDDWERAEGAYLSALGLVRHSLGAHAALAQLMFKTRNLSRCAEILDSARRLGLQSSTLRKLQSELYAAFGQNERAIGVLLQIGTPRSLSEIRRILESGRISIAKAAIRDATGDWINLSTIRSTIAAREAEARSGVRSQLRRRRSGALGQDALIALATGLAQLGRLKAASRVIDAVVITAKTPESFAARPVNDQKALLEAIRITRGAEAAHLFLKRIGGADEGDIRDLPYRMRLAFQAGDFGEVRRLGQMGPGWQRSAEMAELLALTSVLTGDPHEALRISRHHWAIPARYSWVSQVALMAARASGRYKGLSFGSLPVRPEPCAIPKVIVQFWDQQRPPPDVESAMASWRKRNENFQHVVYSEDAAREFLLREFGRDCVELFGYCHHPAMKSDFFRLAYLARRGGIYTDADEESLEPLNNLVDAHPGKRLFLCMAPDAFFVSNGFIASVPAHPIILRTFENAMHSIQRAKESQVRADIWKSTGPEQLTLSVTEAILRTEEADPLQDVGFLYWETRGRFCRIRNELAYKNTVAGNWRALNLASDGRSSETP